MKRLKIFLLMALTFIVSCVPVLANSLADGHVLNDYLVVSYEFNKKTYTEYFYFDRNNLYYPDGFDFLYFGLNHNSILIDGQEALNVCQEDGGIPLTGKKYISFSSNVPFIENEIYDYIVNGGTRPNIPDFSVDDGGGGDTVPPMYAPIVADWEDFTTLIACNLGTMAATGCLILCLMLLPLLLKKLFRFLN